MRSMFISRLVILLIIVFPLSSCQKTIDTIFSYDVKLGDPATGNPRIDFSICVPEEFIEAAKKNMVITIDLVRNPDWDKDRKRSQLSTYVNDGTILEGDYAHGVNKINQERFASWDDSGCISGSVGAFHGTQDWIDVYPIAQIKFNVKLVRGETEVMEAYTYQIPGQKNVDTKGNSLTGDVILDPQVEILEPTLTDTPQPTPTDTPEPTVTPTPEPVRIIPDGVYLTATGHRQQVTDAGKLWAESEYTRTVTQLEMLDEFAVRLAFVEDFANSHFTDDEYTVDYNVWTGQQVEGGNTGTYYPDTSVSSGDVETLSLLGREVPVVLSVETVDFNLGRGFTAKCDHVERYRHAYIEITLKYARECRVYDENGNYWGTDTFAFEVTDTNLPLDW